LRGVHGTILADAGRRTPDAGRARSPAPRLGRGAGEGCQPSRPSRVAFTAPLTSAAAPTISTSSAPVEATRGIHHRTGSVAVVNTVRSSLGSRIGWFVLTLCLTPR